MTAPGREPVRVCTSCGEPLPLRRRLFCGDECRRRFNREERVTENDDFAAGLIRLIRAYGKRVADNDVGELKRLATMRAELDRATQAAVMGLRAHDRSWADIGTALGVTRQAAWERFGRQGSLDGGSTGRAGR